MNTKLFGTACLLVLGACASAPQPRVAQPCVPGAITPVEQSMVEYGTTYTEGMNGPAPAAPEACPIRREPTWARRGR
jgi:hypothetical protein